MKNKASFIGIILTIIILVIVVVVSNISTGNLSAMEGTIGKIFMPIQNGIIFLKNKITGNSQELSDIENLKNDNQKLRDENSKLQEQVRELEILKSENNTLKEYVNLKDKYSNYTTVPAYVIQRSISNYEKLIVINVGTDQGININMPVISESGLVGYVISVTNDTAKVQTIIDTASNVSANIANVKDSVILKGTLNSTDILKSQIENSRMSVTAVSLDEEISNLIKFQHAYNAAARSMTAIDELIDRVINQMGIVGR